MLIYLCSWALQFKGILTLRSELISALWRHGVAELFQRLTGSGSHLMSKPRSLCFCRADCDWGGNNYRKASPVLLGNTKSHHIRDKLKENPFAVQRIRVQHQKMCCFLGIIFTFLKPYPIEKGNREEILSNIPVSVTSQRQRVCSLFQSFGLSRTHKKVINVSVVPKTDLFLRPFTYWPSPTN